MDDTDVSAVVVERLQAEIEREATTVMVRRVVAAEQEAMSRVTEGMMANSLNLGMASFMSPITKDVIEATQRAMAAVTDNMNQMFSEQQVALTRAAFLAAEKFAKSFKVSNVPPIDFEELNIAMSRGVECLLTHGWTIVGALDLIQVRSFATATASSLDEFFEGFYLAEPHFRLRRLRKVLMADPSFSPWKELLRESFRAFNLGMHRVCIPALLSVLEGYAISKLAEAAPVQNQAKVKISTKPKQLLRDLALHDNQFVKGLVWKSVVELFDKLYAKSDFTADSPTFINRHRILHGRSKSDWTKFDALRLFNALDTLRWAAKDLTPTTNAESSAD